MFSINLGHVQVVSSAPGGVWLAQCVSFGIPWRCQGSWFRREFILWKGVRRYCPDTWNN